MLRFIAILVLFVSGCKQVSSDLTFNLVESKNKYGVAPTVSFKVNFNGGHSPNTDSSEKERKK